MPFQCSICAEESTRICVYCTKDTCVNHLCEKCGRCSDCCECEVPLTESAAEPPVVSAVLAGHSQTEPEPAPEPPHPPPDPDPFPEDEPEPGSHPAAD